MRELTAIIERQSNTCKVVSTLGHGVHLHRRAVLAIGRFITPGMLLQNGAWKPQRRSLQLSVLGSRVIGVAPSMGRKDHSYRLG